MNEVMNAVIGWLLGVNVISTEEWSDWTEEERAQAIHACEVPIILDVEDYAEFEKALEEYMSHYSGTGPY